MINRRSQGEALLSSASFAGASACCRNLSTQIGASASTIAVTARSFAICSAVPPSVHPKMEKPSSDMTAAPITTPQIPGFKLGGNFMDLMSCAPVSAPRGPFPRDQCCSCSGQYVRPRIERTDEVPRNRRLQPDIGWEPPWTRDPLFSGLLASGARSAADDRSTGRDQAPMARRTWAGRSHLFYAPGAAILENDRRGHHRRGINGLHDLYGADVCQELCAVDQRHGCAIPVAWFDQTKPLLRPDLLSGPTGAAGWGNRDRGTSRDAAPPTPPGTRVRTTAVRRIKHPPAFPWRSGRDDGSELW